MQHLVTVGRTYCTRVRERVQVRLLQEVHDTSLVGRRLLDRRPFVAQDGGVDAVGEARSVGTVRVGTDPVVVDRLVGIKLNKPQPSAQFLFLKAANIQRRSTAGPRISEDRRLDEVGCSAHPPR